MFALFLVGTAAASAPNKPAKYDIDLKPCPDCPKMGWEVFDVPPEFMPQSAVEVSLENMTGIGERDILDNGVERPWNGEGYSEMITFGGYSSTSLCTRYNRTEHLNGHTKCPLKKDWYHMWRPEAQSFLPDISCWIDDMTPVQKGSTLHNPPGTNTVIGTCPKAGADPVPSYKGGNYDFRYGGIRPQDDNPDAALYPEIAKHIEDVVEKADGKKVVIKGCSGGTINSYAFIMSQTLEWRKKHILAWVPMSPVFGGTITSLESVLSGWQVGGGDAGRCLGRSVAIHLPSVLWMWPHPGTVEGEWNKTEVLIMTPSKNYTAYDLDRMLTDLGLPKSQALYDLEKNDLLGKFEPPMVDTYAFYGFGIKSPAGYKFDYDFTPAVGGPTVCPPGKHTTFYREWDNGDMYPRRSNARAGVWAEAHARAGVALKNYGYKGQKHSCSCSVAECTHDYNCLMAKLKGDAPPAGC